VSGEHAITSRDYDYDDEPCVSTRSRPRRRNRSALNAGLHRGLIENQHFESGLRTHCRFLLGRDLRLVLAKPLSWRRFIEVNMLLEAPRSDDRLRFPRLAARAAPAAICCFLDFAGMSLATHCREE